MIMPQDRIDALLRGETVQRDIPDHEDMYGWICGYLSEEPRKLQYSSLCVSGTNHRTIFQRDACYPVQSGYKTPIQGHVRLILIHRGDNSNWILHLERDTR